MNGLFLRLAQKERSSRLWNVHPKRTAFLAATLFALVFAAMALAGETRRPILAGTWYPENPETLRAQINGLLAAVPETDPRGEVVALAAPHAGYVYSAEIAACAYGLVAGRSYDLVVVISPSHRLAFAGAALPGDGAFATPLGDVPLDRDAFIALMKADPDVRVLPGAHDREHAVEIQLPFLQTALKGPFRLLPVVMGSQDFASCRKLAAALASVVTGRNALIVASSDLSHFHPKAKARALDERFMDRVAAFDPQGLADTLESGASEACGGGPVITAMLAARLLGADTAKVLCSGDSSRASGDENQVVGYMAAAFFKSGQ